jgi:glycosyltransferase involved in cell wall biosynthesis
VTLSIVMPVHNRTTELRRALRSLARQTLPDFECLVVDDASTVDVAGVVAEFDSRFVYLRSHVNTGPSGARIHGFERMTGDFLFLLDSDNELFPWALERAAWYLRTEPDVAGVSGLYVYPDGLRVRVRDGRAVITPQDYARRGSSLYDMAGAVRREVVAEWLMKGRGYYAMEFHLWLTYHLRHSHLAVDEPWGRYHEGTGPRVSSSNDERRFRDVCLFVEEHRPSMATVACRPLDDFLSQAWVGLRRRRRPEAALLEEWMALRGLSRTDAVVRRAAERLRADRSRVVTL